MESNIINTLHFEIIYSNNTQQQTVLSMFFIAALILAVFQDFEMFFCVLIQPKDQTRFSETLLSLQPSSTFRDFLMHQFLSLSHAIYSLLLPTRHVFSIASCSILHAFCNHHTILQTFPDLFQVTEISRSALVYL